MTELKMRLNIDTEEVELVIDNEVALSSGADVFQNWVDAYNDKHKPVLAPEAVTPVEPVVPAAPVEEKKVDVDEPVKPVEPVETETVETKDEDA